MGTVLPRIARLTILTVASFQLIGGHFDPTNTACADTCEELDYRITFLEDWAGRLQTMANEAVIDAIAAYLAGDYEEVDRLIDFREFTLHLRVRVLGRIQILLGESAAMGCG